MLCGPAIADGSELHFCRQIVVRWILGSYSLILGSRSVRSFASFKSPTNLKLSICTDIAHSMHLNLIAISQYAVLPSTQQAAQFYKDLGRVICSVSVQRNECKSKGYVHTKYLTDTCGAYLGASMVSGLTHSSNSCAVTMPKLIAASFSVVPSL